MSKKPMMENTVIHVESQKQWDEVCDYYSIKWISSGDYYRNQTCGMWIRPIECGFYGWSSGPGCSTYKGTYNDFTIITFAKWKKLIKEQEIQSVKCRCGGNPDFFTVSFGWVSIRCDRCDVRIPAVDCDRNDYHTKLGNDWNKAMTM